LTSEILNGLREIREFWDPYMSESYFKMHILPELRPHLFSREKYRGKRKTNIPVYYIYKTLLITLKIKYEKGEL
jgi:hypothetical protein